VSITLVIGNVTSYIQGDLPKAVNDLLSARLSFQETKYIPLSHFKSPWRQIRTALYKKRKHEFGTGHIGRVSRILHYECGLSFTVNDQRTVIPQAEPIDISHLNIRDYQDDAINIALDKKSGVWLIATGGGKSLIISVTAGIINAPTMIYVHTIDLLDQMRENLYDYLGIEAGQIGDGIIDIRQFTVATMQSVVKALGTKKAEKGETEVTDRTRMTITEKKEIIEAVEGCHVAIVDEVHHATCKTIQTIMQHSKSARYRYGATATLREDKADLLIEGAFGKILYKKTISELIKEHWLVPPTIYFRKVPLPNVNDPVVQRMLKSKYPSKYKYFIVNNAMRNAIACKAARRIMDEGMKVLILVQHIPHGQLIIGELGKDYSMAFLQGRIRSKERREVLEDFRKGIISGVVATTLADEGLDVPILDAAVLLGGGRSSVKAFQRIGRTVRLYKDEDYTKTRSHIIEFQDQIKPFASHAKRRLQYYSKESEFKIKVQ